MKKLSLKNNITVNEKNIKALMSRIKFNPNQETIDRIPPIIMKRVEFSINCLHRIELDKVKDKDMKIDMFVNPLRHKALTKVENGFVDTSTIGMIVDAKTCSSMKVINPNEYINTAQDVLDSTELLVGVDIVRRKSMLISSTSLVSKNKKDINIAIPHVEIAIWDGYINSPNSYIIYIEKFIDRYRFIYLEKIPTGIDTFKYNVYDFDCDCKLLSVTSFRDISVEENILHVVSSQRNLYSREELLVALFDRYNLIPRKK